MTSNCRNFGNSLDNQMFCFLLYNILFHFNTFDTSPKLVGFCRRLHWVTLRRTSCLMPSVVLCQHTVYSTMQSTVMVCGRCRCAPRWSERWTGWRSRCGEEQGLPTGSWKSCSRGYKTSWMTGWSVIVQPLVNTSSQFGNTAFLAFLVLWKMLSLFPAGFEMPRVDG